MLTGGSFPSFENLLLLLPRISIYIFISSLRILSCQVGGQFFFCLRADNNLKTNVFFQERRSLSREYKLPPCFRFRLKGETSWQTFPHTVFKYIFFSGFKGRNTVLKFQHQPMFAFSLKIATRGLCKSASLVISDFLKFNCKPKQWKLSFCFGRFCITFIQRQCKYQSSLSIYYSNASPVQIQLYCVERHNQRGTSQVIDHHFMLSATTADPQLGVQSIVSPEMFQ